MNKKSFLLLSAVLISVVVLWFFLGKDSDTEVLLSARIEKKDFKNEVVSSGELSALNSIEILGPSDLRKYKLNSVKIQDLVSEGTVVKKGDYVAQLDPSALNGLIIDMELDVENARSKYKQTQLDSALTLRAERNSIKNKKFDLEQKKITLEQSVYEPPATIRQVELDLEKAQRELIQNEENYKIKKEQAIAKMVEATNNLNKKLNLLSSMKSLLGKFTIYAPQNGMLTYIKEWRGEKRSVGSQINSWDTRIAQLPDMSKMRSVTYVNEVDISKVSKGQKVSIGLDAFPDIKLIGEVIAVANIGENKKNSDTKVFQVEIDVEGSNPSLRPGMTTSNRILTKEINDVLIAPIESVFSEGGVLYVYTQRGSGIVKQEVEIGERNNNELIIKKGLNEGDEVYLNEPSAAKSKKINLLKK